MIARVLRPSYSHVLAKNRFEDLLGRWECVNEGEAPGQASLQFVRPPNVIAAKGPITTVAPGASEALTVTWNLKNRLLNGDVRLEMTTEVNGATIAVHRFTLTVA